MLASLTSADGVRYALMCVCIAEMNTSLILSRQLLLTTWRSLTEVHIRGRGDGGRERGGEGGNGWRKG